MEISNRDKKLLVYLLAVLIIAAAYMFGAKPFLDKQMALSDESVKLRSDVNHYSIIHSDMAGYQERTIEFEAQYQEALTKFFVGMNQEDTIVMLRNIENEANIWINKIAFQESQVLVGTDMAMEGAITEADAQPDESEEVSPSGAISGIRQDLSIDYSATYPDFKKFLEIVKNNNQRLYISSLSAVYSIETGRVTGNIILSQYALEGSGVERVAPDLSSVDIGVENIFSTSGDFGMTFGTVENTQDGSELTENEYSDETENTEETAETEDTENIDIPASPASQTQAEESKPQGAGGGII